MSFKIRRLIYLFMFVSLGAQASLSTQTPYSVIDTRIVGGTQSTSGEWPWIVALITTGFTPYSGQFCGGSLVDDEWVLTAAHCVTNLDGSVKNLTSFNVSVGEYDLDNPSGTVSSISQILVYPGFNNMTLDADLAMVKLSSALVTNDTLPVIADSQINYGVAFDTTVIGWGDTEVVGIDPDHPTNAFPSILRSVTVPYVNNTTCNSSYSGDITGNMMCAGTTGVDSCQGDSGGPLVVIATGGAWHQAGIVSWGQGCADVGFPGVYTRLSVFKPWIDDVLNGTITSSSYAPVIPAEPTASDSSHDSFFGAFSPAGLLMLLTGLSVMRLRYRVS